MSNYEGSGGVTVKGCGKPLVVVYRSFRFGPGYVVYVAYEATRGLLRRVSIKRVNLIQNRRTYGRIVPMYVDQDNALFEESDLCTESEAIAFTSDFYNNKLVEIDYLMKKC